MKRIKQYCFKPLHQYGDMMFHTESCRLEEPSPDAWNNIHYGNWFDIKLQDAVSFNTYIPVIEKIKDVAKTKLCIFHFSNAQNEPFGPHQQSLFWECINHLADDIDYGLEVCYKLDKEELYNEGDNIEFLSKIIQYTENNNHFKYVEIFVTRNFDDGTYIDYEIYKRDKT